MSSFHLSPRFYRYYAEAIAKYGPTHALGYPSALSTLAQAVLVSGRQDLKMSVVITNAEPVYDFQRTIIAQAFKCPVQETYGMAEIVVAGSECTASRLHLWPEVGWVEVMERNEPLADGTSGDLVCTGLFNVDMPLIRYKVGDRGSLNTGVDHCLCGRNLPGISRIEGRANDVLVASDGRRVYWLNPVFYGLPVREAQIIQEAFDKLRVRYVPAPDASSHTERSIMDRLYARMGKIEILMERVDAVPRGPNGKFRAVISKLSKEEREYSKNNHRAFSGY
jgi:phenylacetate-CoA ligase